MSACRSLDSASQVAISLLLIAVAAGLYWLELAIPKRDYFIERRGALVRADISEASSDGIVQKLVRLESSTGLQVSMRVVRPATAPGTRRHPVGRIILLADMRDDNLAQLRCVDRVE